MHANFLFFLFPFVFSWGIAAILFIPYFLPTIITFIRRSNSARRNNSRRKRAR